MDYQRHISVLQAQINNLRCNLCNLQENGTGGGGGLTQCSPPQYFTALDGDTIFTVSGGYTVDLVAVFYNGSKLAASEFTATDGSTIVLGFPAIADDVIEVDTYCEIDAGSGSSETWQETLINGSDLTQNNLVDAAGFEFEMDNVGLFQINHGDITYTGAANQISIGGNISLYNQTDANIYSQLLISPTSIDITVFSDPTYSEVIMNGDGSMSVKGELDSSIDAAPNVIGIDVDGNWHIYDAPDSTFISTPEVVSVATTIPLPTSTYNNGTGGVGATITGDSNGALVDIDGVTPLVDTKILVKDQVSAIQNGVYTVTQVGDVGTPFILTRVTSSDETSELYPQGVTVVNGTVNASLLFIQQTVNPIVGTNDIIYDFTLSLSPTWQNTLDNSSTLNKANTIAGGGFDFTWDNMAHYINTTPLGGASLNGRLHVGIDNTGSDKVGFRVDNKRIPLSVFRIMDRPSGGSGANTATNIELSNNAGVRLLSINGSYLEYQTAGSPYVRLAQGSVAFVTGNTFNGTGMNVASTFLVTNSNNTTLSYMKSTGQVNFGAPAAGTNTGAPHATAVLQSDAITRGFLPPRVTKVQRNRIGAATGSVSIIAFASLAGATLTVAGHALVEGTDWTAATSNDATASSLQAAIDALSEVDATVSTQFITIIAASAGTAGNSITLTTSDGTNMPVSGATLANGIAPATGLIVYQTDNTAGVRAYNGTHWVKYSETNDD